MTDLDLTTPSTRRHGRNTRALAGIDNAILIHAPHTDVRRVAAFSGSSTLNTVYTIGKGNITAAADRLLTKHREIAGAQSRVLFDANRYSGKNRKAATEPLDADWVNWQLDHGSPLALTDSGYLSLERFDDVHSLLADAAQLAARAAGPVMAVLPIDYLILKNRANDLLAAITSAGIPVALAVGHTTDPFGSAAAVTGLLTVLTAPVPIALLRSDLSAVGAVAGGAIFGAVGTASSLRHIWTSTGGGGRGGRVVSVYVPRLMSYHHLERLPMVAAQMPGDYFWCFCEICQGDPVFDRVGDHTAFAHSIGSIAAAAREVLVGSREDRLASFRSRAMNAQMMHMDIAAQMEDTHWDAPSSLNAWVKAAVLY
ncbi:hypothetical protein [Microbacterium sp. As-52]|uniref:hypothetical protein n=1 Tax=Microbacterium sp. As-52 TaxID=3390503 RepID=UPI003CEC0EED